MVKLLLVMLEHAWHANVAVIELNCHQVNLNTNLARDSFVNIASVDFPVDRNSVFNSC